MATLLHLPKEYIVYREIFSHLSLHDLLNLRFASKDFEPLVDGYFGTLKYIDWEELSPTLITILSKTTRNLREIDPAIGMNLDDFIVRPMLRGNQYISNITLTGTCLITKYGVQPIADLKHLTRLIIRNNDWVDDNFTEGLTMNLQSDLISVDLSMCPVSDRSLVGFVTRFKKLRHVQLENLPKMSDRTLYAMSKNNHDMENISFFGNEKLSERAIRAVIESCPNKKSVCILGCTQVSRVYRDHLRRILLHP